MYINDTAGYEKEETVMSFRAGYNGFFRVNDFQIVGFYNDSISTTSNVKWIKVRFLNK